MAKPLKYSLIILTLLFVTSCVSTPPILRPSTDLISQPTQSQSDANAIPSIVQNYLNSDLGESSLSSDEMEWLIARRYVSALGLECVSLKYNPDYSGPKLLFREHYGNSERVLCKGADTDKWSLVSSILDKEFHNRIVD